MSNSKKKADGRGRSAGSRANQFSSDNQPERREPRKAKRTSDAVEIIRSAIYEKVRTNRHGKWVKIPFIEAFVLSMRKNAFSSKLGDQIKFYRELVLSGIFDLEEYKEKLFKGVNNYFKRLLESYIEISDFLEELKKEYSRNVLLHNFYFIAYVTSRENCTCGACDRGVKHALWMMPLIVKAVFDPEPEDEDEDEERAEAPAKATAAETSDSVTSASLPEDDDPENEFYRGMGPG